MDTQHEEQEQDLKATLGYIVRILEQGAGELSSYRHLNPKLQLICSSLNVLLGVTTQAYETTDDILSELQGIPDNFSTILQDVNLMMSQADDGTVRCTVVPIVDGFSLENAQTVSDMSVVAVLLKAFSLVRSGVMEREVLYRIKVTALSSNVKSRLDIPRPCLEEDCDYFLVLEGEDRKEFFVSELEVGKVYNQFKIIESTDEHILIEWTSPFVGVLKLEA